MLRLASRKTRASSTAGNTPTSSLGKYPWADMQRLKKPRDHLGERKNCPSVKSNAFQLIGLRRVDVGGQAFKKKRVDTPKQEPARNDSKNPQYRDRGLAGLNTGLQPSPASANCTKISRKIVAGQP